MSEEIKDALKGIFSSLFEGQSKESREDPLFRFLQKNEKWFGDPEDFSAMVTYKYKSIVQEAVNLHLGMHDGLVSLIYTDWDFLENNVNQLCIKLYGNAYCADRSRYLLMRAISWKRTGELPIFQDKYWEPKSGTPLQWMNFIEGLGSLYYGEPEKYLTALLELQSSPTNELEGSVINEGVVE